VSEAKLTKKETEFQISQLSKQMAQAAKDLDFEQAAQLRDEILELKATL
jgi:excinuclease ABC subunit B